MKKRTLYERVGREICNNCLIPYKSRSGHFAGTHKIGTDKDGKPVYKYLRLKHIKSTKELMKYYSIMPRPNVWKHFKQVEHGEPTSRKLEAQIHRFSAPIRMKDLDSANHTQNDEISSERPKSAQSEKQDKKIGRILIQIANLLLK